MDNHPLPLLIKEGSKEILPLNKGELEGVIANHPLPLLIKEGSKEILPLNKGEIEGVVLA